MSAQRIDNPNKGTYGWQARVPLCDGRGSRLTKFCADEKHGGVGGSLGAALKAEVKLWRLVGKKPKALRRSHADQT